jgi:hypothetical protein
LSVGFSTAPQKSHASSPQFFLSVWSVPGLDQGADPASIAVQRERSEKWNGDLD